MPQMEMNEWEKRSAECYRKLSVHFHLYTFQIATEFLTVTLTIYLDVQYYIHQVHYIRFILNFYASIYA